MPRKPKEPLRHQPRSEVVYHAAKRNDRFVGIDDLAYKLCLLGLGDKEIAEVLGLTGTLEAATKGNESLRDAVRLGRLHADAAVANALFRKATGYTYVDKVLVKTRSGSKHDFIEDVQVVDVEKEMPPDTQAAVFWLQNRKALHWQRNPDAPTDPNKVPATIQVTFVGAKQAPMVDITPTFKGSGNGHAGD